MRNVPPHRSPAPAALVVDDDAGVRDVCAALLDALGFVCVGARDGAEALERAATVDVVLLDVHMPGMDGQQTLRQLRRLRPELPVVAMSGQPREDLGRLLALGASAVLRKPFGLAELAQCLAGWSAPTAA